MRETVTVSGAVQKISRLPSGRQVSDSDLGSKCRSLLGERTARKIGGPLHPNVEASLNHRMEAAA
jgi:hypothetical protein